MSFSFQTAPAAPPTVTVKSGYQPQLDGLRGIAILSVLLHHFGVYLPPTLDWGPIGVRMFFLLSGYLITLSLWRMQDDARKAGGGSVWAGLFGFHTRRMTRLAPVLYIMVAVGFLMGLPEFRDALVWHLAFLSNFHALNLGAWPGAASHLWSLSVQEQFYLLWPFVILLTPRRWLPWVLVGLFLGALGFRAATIELGLSNFTRWVMLPGVFDSFAIGALIACAKKSGRTLSGFASGKAGISLGVIALGCYVGARMMRLGPFAGPWAAAIETLENLFFGWLLLRTAAGWSGPVKMLFENSVLMYLGRVSYGLYIFHVLVLVSLGPWLTHAGLGPEHVFLRALVFMGVSVGVAAISFHFVESPLAAWVRRREVSLPGTRAQEA